MKADMRAIRFNTEKEKEFHISYATNFRSYLCSLWRNIK